MRTRFTYVALLLAVTAGAVVTAVSCSPDAGAPESAVEPRSSAQSLDELRENYGWMGDYHTQALSQVHQKLSEKKNRGLGKAEKCRVGIATVKEFHRAFRRNGRPLGYTDVSTIDGFCETAVSGGVRVSGSVNSTGLGSSRADLSAPAVSKMTEIERAFDADLSRTALESRIYDIQSSAAESLPTEEAGAVVGLGSLALSSIAYWDENLGSWGSSGPDQQAAYNRSASGGPGFTVGVGDLTPRYGLGPRGRAIIKADVAAGFSTLLYEWWLGGFALEKALIRAAAASLIAGLLY